MAAAGRSADEASAVGQMMAARYDARAAWFEGRKGTEADLYAKEGPDIVGADRGGPKGAASGKTRFGEGRRPVITLFSKADAGTIIHESGHVFLRELLSDAADAVAPDQLRADGAAVRGWFGVAKAEDIAPRHEEQFARAFERYLYEGRAPTPRLAGVFERFRSWLLDIYQHLKGSGTALPDSIRDVFDRLLAREPERPQVARPQEPETAEPGPAPSRGSALAAIHERDAETAPPQATAAIRDHVADELGRELAADEPDLLEMNDGRDGRRGPAEAGDGTGPRGDTGGVPLERRDNTRTDEPAGELAALGAGAGQAESRGLGVRAKSGDRPLDANAPFPEQPVADKAGNIRLDLLHQPEDVNTVIRQVARENGGFLTARRGVVSDAQVLQLAEDLGMKASDLNQRHIGQAFNAEQVVAARQLLIQSATAVRDASLKAAASGSEADLMAFARAKARHVMIQEQVSGITAEAGRALRAFRSIDGLQDARAGGQFVEKATGQTLFQLRAEAEALAGLDTPAQVSRFVHDSQKPKFKDYLLSYYINNLISGPITHTTYAIGNAARNLVKTLLETPAAALLGEVQEALGYPHQERVQLAEVAHQLTGLAYGLRVGLGPALSALKTGVPFMKGVVEQAAMDLTHPTQHGSRMQPLSELPGLAGHAGYVLETPGRAVTAIHTLFYSMAYEQEMAALAFRRASSEGLDGARRVTDLTAQPDEAMIERAHAEALDMVLMRKPEFGSFSHTVEQLANSNLLTKLIVPFARVGTNIVRGAAESTPLGLLSVEVRETLAGKYGADRQQMQAAKIAVGTGVGVGLAVLTVNELATGGGPTDPNERRLWLVDHQPYSVRIGNRWVPYRKLGPIGMVMGAAADMVEIGHHLTEDEATASAANIVMAISEVVLDETWMRGLHDLLQAVFQPKEYGERYLRDFATSFMPFSVGISQVNRTLFDPYSKEARTLLDAARAKIPGLSGDVANRIDWKGEPIRSKSVLYGSSATEDPASRELARLELFPAKVTRQIAGVDLTPVQYEELQRTAGVTAHALVLQTMKTPGWDQVPDQLRAKVLDEVIFKARQLAKTRVMMMFPQIMRDASAAKLEGLTP
ncbi:MAG: hypothetical protein HQL37_03550 [Alphaproteobacteria bacterium]|nr:hypothetical protein [Alphaproteobacteria bacterium]